MESRQKEKEFPDIIYNKKEHDKWFEENKKLLKSRERKSLRPANYTIQQITKERKSRLVAESKKKQKKETTISQITY